MCVCCFGAPVVFEVPSFFQELGPGLGEDVSPSPLLGLRSFSSWAIKGQKSVCDFNSSMFNYCLGCEMQA